MLGVLRHATRYMQVIVTTHSPEVLDAEWLTDDNLRIVTWANGNTRILPISGGTRDAIRQHLMSAGELFRSNALRPADASTLPSPQMDVLEDVTE